MQRQQPEQHNRDQAKGAGEAVSSNLQTNGPLTARTARPEDLCLKLAALAAEDTVTPRSLAGDSLVSSKGGSEKLLSVGGGRGEKKERGSVPSMWPWAMAQLLGYMTQVLLPELASSCLG